DTARLTLGVRISRPTSAPSTIKPSGPKSTIVRFASAVSAGPSDGSIPSRRALAVRARYIAPVSRCAKWSARATPRATVLFPAPAGPSMATTNGRRRLARRGLGGLGIALGYDEAPEVLFEAGV